MSNGEIFAWGGVTLAAIYLAARLISAAFFRSKQQYEQRRKHHG